jgi:hypothetical protein
MLEIAFLLPLFVLFMVGVFALGCTFIAFNPITNVDRIGALVASFGLGETEINDRAASLAYFMHKIPMSKPIIYISSPGG